MSRTVTERDEYGIPKGDTFEERISNLSDDDLKLALTQWKQERDEYSDEPFFDSENNAHGIEVMEIEMKNRGLMNSRRGLFSSAYIKQSFDWDNFDDSVKEIVEEVDGYDFRIHDNGDFRFKCDHPLSYIQRVFKSNGFDYWWKIDRDLTSSYKNEYRFSHEDGSSNPDEIEGEY